jgi:hypothetical protein
VYLLKSRTAVQVITTYLSLRGGGSESSVSQRGANLLQTREGGRKADLRLYQQGGAETEYKNAGRPRRYVAGVWFLERFSKAITKK